MAESKDSIDKISDFFISSETGPSNTIDKINKWTINKAADGIEAYGKYQGMKKGIPPEVSVPPTSVEGFVKSKSKALVVDTLRSVADADTPQEIIKSTREKFSEEIEGVKVQLALVKAQIEQKSLESAQKEADKNEAKLQKKIEKIEAKKSSISDAMESVRSRRLAEEDPDGHDQPFNNNIAIGIENRRKR